MRKLTFILSLSLIFIHISFAQTDTSIIFSEIMFSPASGPNEFIELYNQSETDTIDLTGFKIKYYTSNSDQLIDAGFGNSLPPKSFAVIFEGDYDLTTGIYNGLVPPNALILKIADNSFGTSGMANTSDRPLKLINALNDTIDNYTYSANNSSSFSDEKIILNRDSSQTNWTNSLLSNGTPGFTNSVTPLYNDLWLSTLTFSPAIIFEGEDVTINCRVKNRGLNTAENFTVEIFNDADNDSIPDPFEIIFSQNYSGLASEDSIQVSTMLTSLESGTHQIIANVSFADDENPDNNNLIKSFVVYPPGNIYNDLVLNEIMYAPVSPEPEWIELFNRKEETINIKNWKISDANTSVIISDKDIIIDPKSFIVITSDSSINNFYDIPAEIVEINLPTLNNSGDAVVIKDSLGVIIDSVFYLPDWGGNSGGRSLERISADLPTNSESNWNTSEGILKATPGKINSVTQKDFDVAITDLLFYPQFPFKGDNVSIAAKVFNAGKNNAQFSLQLFEDTDLDSIENTFLEETNNLTLSPSDSGEYTFNYSIEDLQNKRAFIAKALFLSDEDTLNNFTYNMIEPGFPSQTIVINEILFAPLGGEPEWIELYNNSDLSINIINWEVNDVITTPVKAKIPDDLIIEPQKYVVLSKDSSIFNYHRKIDVPVYVLNLPSFNNDQDGVVLKDYRGLIIDSVLYSNQWGGSSGFSLERISATGNSNLSSNWGTSIDIEQSTPGRINSITPKQNDVLITEINFNPEYPVNGDDVFISAKIKNAGLETASDITVQFFIDTDSNDIVDKLLSSTNNINLQFSDSLAIISDNPILNLQDKVLTAVRVIFNPDEDTLNNYLENYIEPGYAKGLVRINEVMYNPADEEPEWIEFVNTSGDSINLKYWKISDVISTPISGMLTNENIYTQPDEYFIVAKDSSFKSVHPDVDAKIFIANFGTLGNTSDGVMIYDFRDAVIDSLFYNSSWGGKKGVSLEKIEIEAETNDSSFWTSSLSLTGSTPGRENSILNLSGYEKNTLIINEIFADPAADNSEFIELYNVSQDSVNIGGWKIIDENDNSFLLFETSFVIPPLEYFVLIADTLAVKVFNLENFEYKNVIKAASLGLVNSGEIILLKDVKGSTIDSVFYSDSWHNNNLLSTKNKSLERINPYLGSNDPLNWSTSVNPLGGTPGFQNSIFTENLNTASSISIDPNPFSPDNDGFEDFTLINYNLTQQTAQVRIKIFDSKGRLVRTLINNQASGSSGSVVFDGLSDEDKSLRMGIYIVFLEALNNDSGVVETLKTTVVIARKL